MRDDLPASPGSAGLASKFRALARALRHPLYSLGLRQHQRFPAVDVAYLRYLALVQSQHCAECPHGSGLLDCAAHPPASGRPYGCPLGDDAAHYARRPLAVATVTSITRRPDRATPLRHVWSDSEPSARDQGSHLGP
jgi:hypothetical protein